MAISLPGWVPRPAPGGERTRLDLPEGQQMGLLERNGLAQEPPGRAWALERDGDLEREGDLEHNGDDDNSEP